MKSLPKTRKYLSLSVFSLLLGGCAPTLTPDFSEMSAKYAYSLEQYQTNSIFQNILRAADNRMVSFLDMPTINGSGTITPWGIEQANL